jgi:hypothetical protein
LKSGFDDNCAQRNHAKDPRCRTIGFHVHHNKC